MGTTLTGLTPATTYDALIKVGDNGPITGALKVLSDGLGTNLPMEASTTAINFTGTTTVGGVAVANTTQLATKQDTLVSGTNIKTINSTSLLGSGNIAVVTSPSGVAGAIQFSNGSAFASDASNLFWDDTNNRLGIGTNAPASQQEIKGNGDQLWITNSSDIYTYLKLSANGGLVSMTFGDGNGTVNYLNNYGTGMWASNKFAFGPSLFTPSGQVHIKGSGSTSATTSLLVQNSSGVSSLQVNDKGSVFNLGKGSIGSNTVFGLDALQANTTGSQNTVMGLETLYSNTTGLSNSAFGLQSMFFNTTGGNNTAMGVGALISNTTGSSNSALGVDTESGNFSGSVILGRAATATASNQFVVGSSSYNAGAVTTATALQTKTWDVIINGVAQKILLA